jgi:hypothetical protein
LTIPVLSGYGPSVSEGVTAHVDGDVIVVVDEVGLVGDDAESPQPIVNAIIPAKPPNASMASRRFNFGRSLGSIAYPFI